MTYHGFTIEQNHFGWFNVVAINCFSSPSEESAKRAIDRYAAKNNLCEHGVPKLAKAPVCGCPGSATTGKAAYEADVLKRPTYHDGAPRKTWEQLGDVEQWSWNRPEVTV